MHVFLVYLIISLSQQVHGYATKNSSFKPPFIHRQDMCGIWKLRPSPSTDSASASPEVSDQAVSIIKSRDEDDIVLRLNDDGKFEPFSESSSETTTIIPSSIPSELHFTMYRGGCWEYRTSDNMLILAVHRSSQEPDDDGAMMDIVLMGKVVAHVTKSLGGGTTNDSLSEDDSGQASEGASSVHDDGNDESDMVDVHLSIPEGQVLSGKCMYPRKHRKFFEEPVLFYRKVVGNFGMNQLIGNVNSRLEELKRQRQKEKEARFRMQDMYNRTFYLTAVPHPVNKAYADVDVNYDEDKATIDIRVTPIIFFANNTFAIVGIEKILRGRYGITGPVKDKLWFQVSLFGAGRSAPGSVYSEGRQLSKDDQRGYVGGIQSYPGKQNRTTLFVDGEFYYGEDLENPRRTRSFGSFTLQETTDDDGSDDGDADTKYSLSNMDPFQ